MNALTCASYLSIKSTWAKREPRSAYNRCRRGCVPSMRNYGTCSGPARSAESARLFNSLPCLLHDETLYLAAMCRTESNRHLDQVSDPCPKRGRSKMRIRENRGKIILGIGVNASIGLLAFCLGRGGELP